MTASTSTANTIPDNFEFVPRTPPKRDWRRAWGAIEILIGNSERTDQVFVLLDALGGPTDEASFQDFATQPQGRRQLSERPDLLAALSDHASLAALPESGFHLRALFEPGHRRDPVGLRTDRAQDPALHI